MRTLVALFAVAVAAPAVAASDPPPAKVVAKIQKFYDSTKDLHAQFAQAIDSPAKKSKASGEVWLKKPGRMRWDYAKPEKKLMVADGTTLWIYEPEDTQAFRQDLHSSTLPAQVSFLLGQGSLAEQFDASVVHPEGLGAAGDVVLKMVPKTPTTAYRYILFVTDPGSGMVKETVIYDQQGGSNHLTFTAVESNHGVADGKFRFEPPPGTLVHVVPGTHVEAPH